MDDENNILCTIHYYLREKFYGTAFLCCEEACRQFRANHEFVCLKAFSTIKLGKSAEAIRTLTNVKKTSQIELAVSTALKIAYESEATIDKDSVKNIDAEINQQLGNADLNAVYVAATLWFYNGAVEKARSLLDKVAAVAKNHSKILTLRGWIEVISKKDIKLALQSFETSVTLDHFPDAYLGQAQIHKERHSNAELFHVLSNLLNECNLFIPAYIENIKAAIIMRNWDKVTEIAQSASLIQASDCIPIQLCECGRAILQQGDAIATEQLLAELLEATQRMEASNPHCFLKIAKFLGSVACDNNVLRQYSRKFLDEALALSKEADIVVEKSRLLIADGDLRGGLQMAKMAVESNIDNHPDIMFSVVRCYVAMNEFKEAKDQLYFIRDTFKDIDKTTLFYYYQALIARSEGCSHDTYLNELRNTIDCHLSVLQRIPYGLDYVEQLNPVFLVEVAARLFEIAPLTPAKQPDSVLKEIIRTMSAVTDNCPGLGKPCYFLAKAKYLEMEASDAEKLLKLCINKGSSVAEAYLLLAQLLLQRHALSEASKCLDAGLGYSFAVREHPLYFLTKARMLKQEKRENYEEAITMLKNALDLPVFKDLRLARQMDITEGDRIAVYLELIDCYQMTNRVHDADVIMKEALKKYTGSQEEEKLVLMNAQLRLQREDIKGALDVLQAVGPDQPNYQAARIKMAQIYLEKRKDKVKYANCYRDILSVDQNPQTYVLVGDAFMNIQEPTKAIEAYETAMRRNPKDFALAERIGNAYVECHLYHKAITFYETAMKTSKQNLMRLRYAEELFRIRNFEKCELILKEVVDAKTDPVDVPTIREHVGYWMLLSKLHYEGGAWEQSCRDLMQAKTLQGKILGRTVTEVGNMGNEKKLANTICCRLAEIYANKRDFSKATDYYKEAVELDGKDTKSMLALAHIYYTTGKIQNCNQQCLTILNVDRNNNEATLMMADIMYQRSEGDIAMKHFSQLLERNPNQYHSMARCIELHWRKGDVDLAEGLLKKALEANPRANVDAGYNYCKGLIEWYTCDPNSALNYFNRARRDLEWGERAVYNIIEIFLNPDYETLGGEALDPTVESTGENNQAERDLNVKSAERFLNVELRPKPGLDQKFQLMENFIMLSTKNKNRLQVGLNAFLEMMQNDEANEANKVLNVGAVLGASRAYLMLKQTQKAKALLKPLISYTWTLEDADYLEQCWLLLTDVYIHQGKSDQATNILRIILQHNASCIKAFEYMGFLKERFQEFNDAASNYEHAWRLGKHRNPGVGFKLAYNYLKCRKYFESVEISLAILQTHPDYPKIKVEVLDKARMALMT
uniref:Tetratricopeptide repeat protein 21B n=1 Tax=Panagrellus redivivus TaxID=6233 RepID=A0A7E4W4V3_PANRE